MSISPSTSSERTASSPPERVILIAIHFSSTLSTILNYFKTQIIRENDTIILLACYETSCKHIPAVLGGDYKSLEQVFDDEFCKDCHKLLDSCAQGDI